MPKERFISCPGASRDTDGSELLGRAGWDHLAQAQALATTYLDRKTQELWSPERLLPLLAGLLELEPWLHQWHAAEQSGYPARQPRSTPNLSTPNYPNSAPIARHSV
ncbi:hypothetical protein AAH979_22565 [Plantactinospora sp. ZYX-F-223]|uniref:DUF7008 domain-containing protein n=1 Tax=Plantactinospora sp. ZYX-F-223 TaxID=3144103 RepID=UPI0031FBD35F